MRFETRPSESRCRGDEATAGNRRERLAAREQRSQHAATTPRDLPASHPLAGHGARRQAAYSNMFLFGDSLSDSGNNAFVFDYIISTTPAPTELPCPQRATPLSRSFPTRPASAAATRTGRCGRKPWPLASYWRRRGAGFHQPRRNKLRLRWRPRRRAHLDPTPTGFPFNLSTRLPVFSRFWGRRRPPQTPCTCLPEVATTRATSRTART